MIELQNQVTDMHMCPPAGLVHSAHLIFLRDFLLLFIQVRLDRPRLVGIGCAEPVTVKQQVVPEASAWVEAKALLAVHATHLCSLGTQHPQRFLMDTVPIPRSIHWLPLLVIPRHFAHDTLAFRALLPDPDN
jgi:hypothetical protein